MDLRALTDAVLVLHSQLRGTGFEDQVQALMPRLLLLIEREIERELNGTKPPAPAPAAPAPAPPAAAESETAQTAAPPEEPESDDFGFETWVSLAQQVGRDPIALIRRWWSDVPFDKSTPEQRRERYREAAEYYHKQRQDQKPPENPRACPQCGFVVPENAKVRTKYGLRYICRQHEPPKFWPVKA